MAEVVVVGSLSMDLTATTARLPAPGETVIGSSFTMVPGGKGNNQAVTCARQGVATAMVGRVGSDGFGAAIRAQLVAEGVDVSHLTTDPSCATGIAHITVDSAGQNFIIVVPESNHALTVQHVRDAAGLIEHAAVLLVQLEVRLEVVGAALDLARRAGTKTMLNPAPALAVDDELLSKVDLCLPNEVEAAALTGVAVDDVEGAVRAGRALVSRGCGAVVVTLGGKGSVYVDTERVLAVPSFSVPVVDTVAAGDAFCGVLASALARGRDLEASLVRAAAAGALAVGVAGATPSLPTARAVEKILGLFPPVMVKRSSPPGA
ncbi:MAG: ribokinase [Acidimicrobiales bacterium]|jgi:ribokinase